MTTEQTELAIAQYRKRAFIRARLSVTCLEKRGGMKDCNGCKSFRICREVLETI
jgi:hypothetical protein